MGASDTFQRANQAGWGTASDGESWSVQSGSAASLSIASNEGACSNITALTYLELGSNTLADAEALVRFAVSTSGYSACGIILRATGSTTFYRFRINSGNSSIGIGIVKTIAGSTTNLLLGTFAVSTSTFYWIRARVLGPNLYVKIWANGSAEPVSWNLTFSDTSITGAGGYGFCVNTAGATDIAQFDNFSVNTIPPSMGAQSPRREDFIRGRY